MKWLIKKKRSCRNIFSQFSAAPGKVFLSHHHLVISKTGWTCLNHELFAIQTGSACFVPSYILVIKHFSIIHLVFEIERSREGIYFRNTRRRSQFFSTSFRFCVLWLGKNGSLWPAYYSCWTWSFCSCFFKFLSLFLPCKSRIMRVEERAKSKSFFSE